MLRVQIRDASNTFLVKIEGKFSGEDAEYVQTLMARSNTGADLVIDITDVTFVDPTGEIVLKFFRRLGAVFVAENSYSRFMCERLQLPLKGKNKSNGHDRSRNVQDDMVDVLTEHPPEVENPDASSEL